MKKSGGAPMRGGNPSLQEVLLLAQGFSGGLVVLLRSCTSIPFRKGNLLLEVFT